VFFTGLLGIGYEVVGVRMMSQVLENTVYSFAAALSVYLIGTSVGAAAYQRWSHRVAFGPALCVLLSGLSAACLLGGIVLECAPAVYRASRSWFGQSLGGVAARELTVAAMIFALPTVFMGATFSHLVQAARHARGGVGRAAAINTLGGALAPALFGVVLLPAIGAKWAWAAASLGYLALLPASSGRGALLPIVPLAMFLLLPRQMRFLDVPEATRVVAYEQGVMSSVAVLERENSDRGLTVNNHFRMGGTLARVPEQRQAMIPILLHPSPTRALFLGIGTGMTLSGAFFEPGLTCDAVELVPEIVDFLPLFAPENGAPTSRRDVRIFTADARRFVRASTDSYDVIIADLFHPARDGAAALYTVEHFEAVRDRLADGGLFCQWLPLHQMSEDVLRIAVRTFLEVFPHARAYLGAPTLDPPALGLVAARAPLQYPPDWMERRITDLALRDGAASLGLNSNLELFGCLMADTPLLTRFAALAPLNTDNDPVIMFRSPIALFEMKGKKVELALSLVDKWNPDPTEPFSRAANLISADDRRRYETFVRARDVFLRGVAAAEKNQSRAAINAFLSSAMLSRDFSAAYDRCMAAARQNLTDQPAISREILETLTRAYPDRTEPAELLKSLNSPPPSP
jgi:spermidine synthase